MFVGRGKRHFSQLRLLSQISRLKGSRPGRSAANSKSRRREGSSERASMMGMGGMDYTIVRQNYDNCSVEQYEKSQDRNHVTEAETHPPNQKKSNHQITPSKLPNRRPPLRSRTPTRPKPWLIVEFPSPTNKSTRMTTPRPGTALQHPVAQSREQNQASQVLYRFAIPSTRIGLCFF